MDPALRELTLRFGVEMEMLIRPKRLEESSSNSQVSLETFWQSLIQHGWNDATSGPWHIPKSRLSPHNRRRTLRQTLATALTEAGLNTQGEEDDFKDEIRNRDYRGWNLVDEDLDEIDEFSDRIEIVSRTFDTNEDWGKEINALFQILNKYCDIHLAPGCSMHIHVSPSRSGQPPLYSDKELRCIGKALYLFNSAIIDVMPSDRKDNRYARPNPARPKFFEYESRYLLQDRQLIYGAYENAVATQGSWATLFELIGNITSQDVQYLLQPNTRTMAWNFSNINNQKGTIEFRQPPGIDTAHEACHWAAFTLGFAARALEVDFGADQFGYLTGGPGPDVNQLRAFITEGLGHLSARGRNLDRLLSGLVVKKH